MKKLIPMALVCALVSGLPGAALGDAVTSGNIVGYVTGGAGFAFSPNTNIEVTALGYGGSDLFYAPYQISLWDAAGNTIASALISTNDVFSGQAHYQNIPTLSLLPGNTYYLGAVRPDIGLWLGDVIIASGPEANGTFSVAPEISYLGYAYGLDASNVFPGAVSSDPLALLVGPEFLFDVPAGGPAQGPVIMPVPEPSPLSFGATALALAGWRRLRRIDRA